MQGFEYLNHTQTNCANSSSQKGQNHINCDAAQAHGYTQFKLVKSYRADEWE